MPRTKSGLLTLFSYTLTSLFAQRITNNVFSFNRLSYSMPYDMTPLSGGFLRVDQRGGQVCVICIGVVGVVSQYNCIYYCDTCYL
jgi:hypothetical protein